MPLYAETERLIVRSLEKTDLPQIVELIGDWDVARWLSSVPYPYSLKHAEEFFERMTEAMQIGKPEYFLLEHKKDRLQMGAIGLHPPREPDPLPGEMVVGYWLGKDYWQQGLMSEALRSVITLAFQCAEVMVLTAATDLANDASQNVLRKAGFTYGGISPRQDPSLRGTAEVTRWQLTRGAYEKGISPS